MISDKTSQNDAINEGGKKDKYRGSKKVKRCCFLLFLVICQAQSIKIMLQLNNGLNRTILMIIQFTRL